MRRVVAASLLGIGPCVARDRKGCVHGVEVNETGMRPYAMRGDGSSRKAGGAGRESCGKIEPEDRERCSGGSSHVIVAHNRQPGSSLSFGSLREPLAVRIIGWALLHGREDERLAA